MNEVSFRENINKLSKLLDEIDILGKVNLANLYKLSYLKYSTAFLNATRDEDYLGLYKCALENDDYDLLLKDGSFFQFSYDKTSEDMNIRLAFYPTICRVSYEKFVKEILGGEIEEAGFDFIEYYQQFLIEQTPADVTPIRFDYNSDLYEEIIHSAAHIHMGHEENIRIPIDNIIKPIFFGKMVIQFFYFKQWKEKLSAGDDQFLYTDGDFDLLNPVYFSDEDKRIPYIKIR